MPTFTIFGDIKRFARSPRLEEESVITVFGDVKVDFTRQPLDPGDQQMRIFTIFGDVRLRMPEDVGIEIDGFALFGDIEVENIRTGEEEEPGSNYISENFSAAAVRARISVFSLFGGIKVARMPVATANDAPFVGQTSRLLGEGNDPNLAERYAGERERVGERD